MVFDGLKPLKSIEKQTLFLMKEVLKSRSFKKTMKIDAKMAPKSYEK